MFAERLGYVPDRLCAFTAAPPISDRVAWDNLPSDIARKLVEEGNLALNTQWSGLHASDYMQYVRDGNRALFEDTYFSRRRKLNGLVLAECAESQGRFISAIIDGIYLLCEESGWQLPAHNAHMRSGPRAALPDPLNPVIDLFAAETSAQLAMIAAVLGDRLAEVSPQIVERIDNELSARIFTPYLKRHFWWMGNGDEPMNNWTAWCTQNILLAAFSRPLASETRHAIVRKAASSLDAFAKDYGDDGACEEGALYYRHAALCLWGALKVLSTVAPVAFSPLWQHAKIRNMAEYLPLMHVSGRYYLNFADSSAVLEPAGAREFLFGEAVGSEVLKDYALADAQGSDGIGQRNEINLWYRLTEILTAARMRDMEVKRPVPPDRYFPSVGLLVARDAQWTLGVKAGDNGDGHNHNDVGSFTVYRSGQPFVIDIGVETYTAKTFSAERYSIWTMQSAWHNLPSFDGIMQQDGARFAASDVGADLDQNRCRLAFDIAGAYPESAGLRSYGRSVELVKGKGVQVEDSYEGDKAAQLSLLFARHPIVRDWGLELPGLGRVEIDGAAAIEVDEVAIDDPRLQKAWPKSIWRARIPFKGGTLSISIC